MNLASYEAMKDEPRFKTFSRRRIVKEKRLSWPEQFAKLVKARQADIRAYSKARSRWAVLGQYQTGRLTPEALHVRAYGRTETRTNR